MEELKSQLTFLHQKEIDEILETAKKQAGRMITEARVKAEEIKKTETEKILENARETEKQQLEKERLHGKRRIADARFQLLETALKRAAEKLAKLAETADTSYKNSLEKIIIEAAQQTSGQNLEIIVHPRDRRLIEQKLKTLEKQISTIKGTSIVFKMSEEPLRSTGGAILRTTDGRRIFNNTLEARVAEARQEKLAEISKLLFEGSNT